MGTEALRVVIVDDGSIAREAQSEEEIVAAIRDGASGYLFKGSGPNGIKGLLTTREIDVLRLVADGKDNAQIGLALRISPHTVKNHVASILGKLRLDNRTQAAVHAVRLGIV